MSREFLATIDGLDTAVHVERSANGRFVVRLGEREEIVDAREIRPGTWSLLVAERSYVVDIDERGATRAVVHGHDEFVPDMDDAQRKRLARALSSGAENLARGETIRAPIAGRVVKLLVAEGDEVTPGQGVIVLEAMKMENELKAEHGGSVTAVHVEVGRSVETGDILLTLE